MISISIHCCYIFLIYSTDKRSKIMTIEQRLYDYFKKQYLIIFLKHKVIENVLFLTIFIMAKIIFDHCISNYKLQMN